MGYDYFLLVSLEDVGNCNKEEIEEIFFPQFKELYGKLRFREKFPVIGEQDRGWYSFGPNSRECENIFIPEIKLFTKKFPEFTFGFHLFYHDTQDYQLYLIRGAIVLLDKKIEDLTIPINGNIKLNVDFNIDNVHPDRNITIIFNPNYCFKIGEIPEIKQNNVPKQNNNNLPQPPSISSLPKAPQHIYASRENFNGEEIIYETNSGFIFNLLTTGTPYAVGKRIKYGEYRYYLTPDEIKILDEKGVFIAQTQIPK